MEQSDTILISGGLVHDGTGQPPQRADVLVRGKKIEAIAPGLKAEAAQILNAKGMVVTPGFVDMHRHCDIAALADPNFGLLELRQGITSTVVGNCGLGSVPTSPAHRDAWYQYIEPVVGPIPEGMHFPGYRAFSDALKAASPRIDVRFLAALGAVRAAVKGFAKTPFSREELAAARAHVEEAMDSGACGASIGLMYQPECYSTPEELAAMLAPVAERDGVLCVHMRNEGDRLVESVDEAISLAIRAGVRLNISHFKSTGKRNWCRKIYAAIDHIERAQELGLDVTVDFYPYDGGATTLLSILPPDLTGDDLPQALKHLATPEGKRAAREAIYRDYPDWDNMVTSIGWERIIVSATTLPEHAAWQGRDIASLAQEHGYDEPMDLACDLLASEDGKVGMITMSMDSRDVDTIARLPYAAVISDALYGGGGHPHPRLYGAFPRFLRLYTQERSLIPMETAIHKMTGMPAARMGLTDRGVLAPGKRADINVFDPKAFRDMATFEDSKQLAVGMAATLVGGRVMEE